MSGASGMRNVAGAVRARLEEQEAESGSHGELVTVASLKQEFGLGSAPLTEARRRTLGRWLADAGVETEPPLAEIAARTREVELRLARPAIPTPTPPAPIDRAPRRSAAVARRAAGIGKKVYAFVLAVLGLLVLAVLEVPQLLDKLEDPKPIVMTGDLNVAVAGLRPPPDASSEERQQIETLSRVLHDGLREELGAAKPHQGLRLEFRSPARTPPVDAGEEDDLARGIRADFVVHGEVRRVGEELRVFPRFWVAPRLVQQATELTGPYEAGEPLSARDLTTNVVVRERIRAGVDQRARGLAHLIAGLSHYVIADYERAERTLARAAASDGLGSANGRKLLLLFRGNIALKAGELEKADLAYEDALRIDQDYPRALLGDAEVAFAKVRGDCDRRTDAAALAAPLRAFAAIRIRAEAPDGATAAARRRFGTGRVHLCQALATPDARARRAALAAADEDFRAVVAAEARGDELLGEAAAESYGNLGLMASSFGTGDRRATADEALGHYRRAIDLSRRDDRKALFLRRSAALLAELGRGAEARRAAAEAKRLEALVDERERGSA